MPANENRAITLGEESPAEPTALETFWFWAALQAVRLGVLSGNPALRDAVLSRPVRELASAIAAVAKSREEDGELRSGDAAARRFLGLPRGGPPAPSCFPACFVRHRLDPQREQLLQDLWHGAAGPS